MTTVKTMQRAKPKATLPPPGFNRQAMEQLAAERAEAPWLREKRQRAWSHYETLSLPEWRRTDISQLKWETLIPYAPPQAGVRDLAALPPKLNAALAVYGQRAGLALQRDSAQVYCQLSDEAQAQGVILSDLETAARKHPERVQQYLMNDAVPWKSDKLSALHAAFWSGGLFLYVPADVQVSQPIISVLWLEMPQLAVFPPTLLVAEKGSQVTLVSELLSVGCENCPDTYHGGVTELHIGPGANVRYINVQDLGRHVYDLRAQTALMARDSRLDWLSVTLGGRVSRSSQHTIMRQPGGEASITGLYLPDGRQHIAFDTLQDHTAANCTSDLLYQGALMDKARAVYEGTIRAWPGAQKTNAYQSNRNLILSPTARADSLPKLEIEANDLRCTHGSTVSQVDEDHVFYLMSRGIPRPEAVRLIVEGFFQPTLDRLPESLAGLRERLTQAIALKLK